MVRRIATLAGEKIHLEDVGEYVLGTCVSPGYVVEKFNLPQDTEIESLLQELTDGIEICPTCAWWVHTFERTNSDGDEDDHCDNCRPKEE